MKRADPFEPEINRASAGTGKTFALSSRFIGLLAAGQSPDAILATTFTRKAAGEISDRVLKRLAAAALGDDEQVQLLRVHAGAAALTPDGAADLLATLVSQMHRLSVCTLDSFFVRIAGSFALELGLPPGWRVCDEVTDQRLRDEAIAAMLDAEDPQKLITLIRALNPGEVRRAVHEQIASVVGDLFSVYQRQPAREAWCWIDPPPRLSDDLVVQAIEGFAGLEDHVPRTKGGDPKQPWIKAIGSNLKCARARDWAGFIGSGIAAALVKPKPERRFGGDDIPDAVARAYHPLMIHARAVLLGELAERTEATWNLLGAFAGEYRRLQTATRSVRFDTITHALALAAVTDDRLGELYYRLDAQLRHLLLDEFQDTSGEQWRVLRPIAAEIIAHGRQGERSFFCVGDVKQAIYGWRGGEAEVFDSLARDWPHVRLRSDSTTRRCSPPVIEAVNGVFASIVANAALRDDTEAAAAWADAFQTHDTHRKASPGYVRVETGPLADDDEEADPQKVETIRHAAQIVRDLHGAAPALSIGVLTRTNLAVARMIYELRRGASGIIASEEGGNPLTDSPAVAAVLALINLADHPGDTASRFLVAHSPVGGIVGLADFRDAAAAMSAAARVRAALAGEGYGPTLWGWARKLAGDCDRRDLNRLLQLVELAHAYEPDASLRPADFVRYVESRRVADPTASPVRVMTVHQAKGLEFDAVVLCELDARLAGRASPVLTHSTDRTLPPVRVVRYAKAEHQALEPVLEAMADDARRRDVCESLSTLYVAMTRARHALYMIAPPSSPKERSMPKTYAGIVRSALVGDAPLEQCATHHERGDAAWHTKLSAAASGARSPGEAGPTRVSLAASKRRSRGLPRRSPSSLEGGHRVRIGDRMNLAAAGALEAGTRAHKLLEGVGWIEDGRPDVPADDAATLERYFAAPDVRRVLARAAYPADADLALLREHRFAVRLDDTLLAGTFDRVVLVRRGGRVVAADLIDFKTDSADAIDDRVEFYRPQMSAYRRALASMHGLDASSITAKLVFVNPGVVRDV